MRIKKMNSTFKGRRFRFRWEDTVRRDAKELLGIKHLGLMADIREDRKRPWLE
jgi:hypothetical protein